MRRVTRRELLFGAGALTACGLAAAAVASGRSWWECPTKAASDTPSPASPGRWSVEARYYASFSDEGALDCAVCHGSPDQEFPVSYCHTSHTGSYVQCNLCPHQCVIAEGERGHCRARENRGGRLYSMVYGNPCAVHVDPIEKKPFYHFLPGATAFSLATAGCNLRCLYCQNWSISQKPPEETSNLDLPPAEVARQSLQANAPVIAYTYSEPTVFYEYMIDSARKAQEVGLRNVVVSAGYINPEPLRELCQVVDGIKVDLKAYDEEFYRDVCEAELAPVLRTLQIVREMGVHLEIVNLIVPTLNDSPDQLQALARWVRKELGPDVPLHCTRFYPTYRLTSLPPTPVDTLERAREISMGEGLRFVYVGNVPGHPGDNTVCPACGQIIIERRGFTIVGFHLQNGACQFCGEPIPGVWWPSVTEG